MPQLFRSLSVRRLTAALLRPAALLTLAGAMLPLASLVHTQTVPVYEQPPVNYSETVPHDAVTSLQEQLAAGQLAFAGRDHDVLKTVLDELGVSVASQTLVFSKTSLQRGGITPTRPRALYFSDSAYVGWVPNGLIEIVAIDSELGPVFYSFDPKTTRDETPTFERTSDCLRCHGGTFVRDIPAVFARSVFPAASGEPMTRFGSQVVDDRTPFADRWGGWYVTGYHGQEHHRGNALADEADGQLLFTPSDKRPDELSAYFDASDYLAPTSDVVALLVLEHQMAMQNSLTRAAHASRKWLAYQHSLQTHFKEPLTDEPAYDSVKTVFESAVEDVVDRLLFRDEARLPEGVIGSDAFRNAFAQNAPRSRAGHSLKDLSLREHLFANRCSYLVYSDSFRMLPESLKVRILDRLRAALRDRDAGGRYAYLQDDEKQRIYDILVETHPDARRRWLDPAGD